jgi:hypothetical protein
MLLPDDDQLNLGVEFLGVELRNTQSTSSYPIKRPVGASDGGCKAERRRVSVERDAQELQRRRCG